MEMNCVSTSTPTPAHHHHNPVHRLISTTINSQAPPPSNCCHHRRHRQSLSLRTIIPNARYTRCLFSASPGPPTPPDLDPSRPPGVAGMLSTIQDRARIFFVVLFWMSLFFWASAWDGRNSNGPKKGSRFKR